jgi:hypothetical protein
VRRSGYGRAPKRRLVSAVERVSLGTRRSQFLTEHVARCLDIRCVGIVRPLDLAEGALGKIELALRQDLKGAQHRIVWIGGFILKFIKSFGN